MKSLMSELEKIATKYKYRGFEWVTRVKQPITFPAQRTVVLDDLYLFS